MEKAPEELYLEREKRVNDAIQLKEPDRVPVMSLFGFFPAKYAGITFEQAMYETDQLIQAWEKTILEFQIATDGGVVSKHRACENIGIR